MKTNGIFNKRGQATTEVVLLFPLFLIFIIFMTKIFGLLVLVQKMEIASAYAARRWQLESHLTAYYANGWDQTFLIPSIEKNIKDYLGFNNPAMRAFYNLKNVDISVEKVQYWNKVTVTVYTNPPKFAMLCRYNKLEVCKDLRIRDKCLKGYDYVCGDGGRLQVTKHVPNRDRPIKFILPLGADNKKGVK